MQHITYHLLPYQDKNIYQTFDMKKIAFKDASVPSITCFIPQFNSMVCPLTEFLVKGISFYFQHYLKLIWNQCKINLYLDGSCLRTPSGFLELLLEMICPGTKIWFFKYGQDFRKKCLSWKSHFEIHQCHQNHLKPCLRGKTSRWSVQGSFVDQEN